MLTRSVPRFLLEAAFLIAAAAIAALAHLDAIWIVTVMAVAFALVVLTEWMVTRRKDRREAPARVAVTPPPAPKTAAPPSRPAPSAPVPPSTPRTPPAVPARAPAASPPRTSRPAPSMAVPDVAPPPFPPRPTPTSPPVTPPAVKPEPPAPLPVAEPPPAPVAPKVERRKWNVFELQKRARAIAGPDPMRDEELTFLLLYLRDFADISGDLSEDFDPFVRESFSELIE